jgi:hypothetical protein
MPIFLATQEAEIRRIVVRTQPGQIVCETLSQKLPSQKRASREAQVEGPEFKPQHRKKKKSPGELEAHVLTYTHKHAHIHIHTRMHPQELTELEFVVPMPSFTHRKDHSTVLQLRQKGTKGKIYVEEQNLYPSHSCSSWFVSPVSWQWLFLTCRMQSQPYPH